MKNIKSLDDTLSDLRKRGYKTDFSIDTFCLYCGDLDLRLNPDQFKVDEEYRYESGESNEEETILVAITTLNGMKGVLMDSYGSYSNDSCIYTAGNNDHCTVSADK